jgi:hypothetical protein
MATLRSPERLAMFNPLPPWNMPDRVCRLLVARELMPSQFVTRNVWPERGT